jgi:trimeric autotransporter adhesin
MMVVPDSNVTVNFNLATYRGQQGFAGGVVARVGRRVYVNAGVAGSTVRGSTGGRVGVAIGF